MSHPPAPRQRQLLHWLMLAPWGPPLEIDSICDALWPDVDGDSGRSNFSSAARRLRMALGDPAALSIQAGTVAIDTRHCRTDLDLLASLARRREWRCDAPRAAWLASHLLVASQGYNAVLLGTQGGVGNNEQDELGRRRLAAGAAWRQVSLRIAAALEGGRNAGLGVSLCMALERHGLANDRVLAQWDRLAREARLPPSSLDLKLPG